MVHIAGYLPRIGAALALLLGAWLIAGPGLGWQMPAAALAAAAYLVLGAGVCWLGRRQRSRPRGDA